MDWTIIVSIFAAGCLLGAGIHHLVMRLWLNDQRLEKRVGQLQQEFAAYRENVQQHFSKTTQLVNELTASYSAVQKHLIDGKTDLSEAPKGFQLNDNDLNKLETSAIAPEESLIPIESQLTEPAVQDADFGASEPIEMPKDYADKSHPNASGTLSEQFGLDTSGAPSEPQTSPSRS